MALKSVLENSSAWICVYSGLIAVLSCFIYMGKNEKVPFWKRNLQSVLYSFLSIAGATTALLLYCVYANFILDGSLWFHNNVDLILSYRVPLTIAASIGGLISVNYLVYFKSKGKKVSPFVSIGLFVFFITIIDIVFLSFESMAMFFYHEKNLGGPIVVNLTTLSLGCYLVFFLMPVSEAERNPVNQEVCNNSN
jgi:hypothetical protein